MRDVTEWIRGSLLTRPATRRESIQLPPGQAVLGAVLHNIIAERMHPGVGVGTHDVERSIYDEGALIDGLDDERATAILLIGSATEPNSDPALLAAEPRFPRLPFTEDGILIVDAESGRVLETIPSIAQKTGPRINGENVHNIYPPGHARMIDSGVRGNTSHTLRQARLRVAELATANRRKDEFLAMLGHELRNPLAAIHNGIHLLSHQTEETPAPQKIKAMIERQVRRMTQLVDDLLDVSRIIHGRLHLQRERIDLRDVVSNAIQTLESDIKQRNHRLTTALPDAPVWLQADPGRLEQVFVNLLANASKYTDTGGKLAVSLHARDGLAVIRVRDSGIGIAPEVLPHLFDLFRQADEAARRSQSGLGIGLALVRNLVESHGGSVIAASAGLGQGSEFTVRLPTET
jgi:signal transduction histidine kinase